MARSVDEVFAARYGGAKPAAPKKKLPGVSIEDSARAAAAKHGIDERVFLRLIRQESAGDTAAVSKKGAIGLGQLMPDTARELGVDPTNPLENLDGSARYLKQQLDRFGSYDLALAAYNAGPTAVDRAGGIPDIPETQQYVKRIMGDSTDVKPKRSVDEAFAARYGAPAPAPVPAASYPQSPRPYSGKPDEPIEANPIGNPLEALVGGVATSGLKLPFAVGNKLLESVGRNAAQNVVAGAVSDIADQRNPLVGALPNAAVGGIAGPAGDFAGQAAGKLLGPAATRIKALIQSRLTKRLTELELESAGRVASPKNVKQIADLVRTSQELDAAAVPPPEPGVVRLPAGANRATARRLAKLEIERTGGTPTKAEVERMADLLESGGTLPRTPIAPEPNVHDIPMEPAPIKPTREGGLAPEPGMVGLEPTIRATPADFGVPPEPGSIEMAAGRAALEPLPPSKRRPLQAAIRAGGRVFTGGNHGEIFEGLPSELKTGVSPGIRGGAAAPDVESGFWDPATKQFFNENDPALRSGTTPGDVGVPNFRRLPPDANAVEVTPLETEPVAPQVVAGGQAPEPGAFVPPEKAGRLKGVEKPGEFTPPGKKAPAAQEAAGFKPPEKIPSAMDDIERHIAAGRPVPESVANSARAEVATALGADAGPVERVLQALRKAPRIINRQKALIRAERGRRAAAGAARRPEGGGGAAGFRQQKAAMAGEMTALDFEALHDVIPQADMDALHNMIYTSKKIDFFERMTAERGLTSMFSGKLPTTDELKKLRAVFGDAFVKEVLDKRGDLAKLGDIALQTLGGWRSFITSYDLSAPLNQGLYAAAGNPKEFVKALGSMFKSAVSPKAFDELANQIVNRPTYLLMRRSGLGLTDMGHILSDREEAFASSFAEKIPGVAASNRAYVAFLNKMRADVFDKMIREGRASGINLSGDEGLVFTRQVADFVNDATGRGKLQIPLGKDAKIDLSRHADLLNAGFFSPRLMMSRVRLLNPGLYVHQNPVVRKQALRSVLGMATAGGTLLGLAKAAGAEVEADPKATDFGRIKVGNTRYDIFGGFTQYARLAANMMPFAGGPDSGSRLDYLARFGQGKASPAAGFALDLLRGKDFKGMPLDQPLTYGGQDTAVPAWVADRFIPLMMQDIYDVMQEQGPTGALMSIPALFGVRMATYDG